MKKFRVYCTMIYNGHIDVECEDERQAYALAEKSLSYDKPCDFPNEGDWGKAHFVFGEATADEAEEIED